MNLKKISLFLVANIIGLTLMAEGYQLNTQSARQLGMGHIGTALKLGSESMLFNPAGLSFMNGNVDLSVGATGIFSKVTYTSGTYTAQTDNPAGTPIFGYAGFKITDFLYAGISLTNPAGNSLVWPDNWYGSHLVQNISLKVFSAQPTISFKLSEKLSIGAGLMVNFGEFDMNKGLLPVNGLNGYLASPVFPAPYKAIITNATGLTPVSANLAGKTDISYGFNIGILYNPTEKLSIGLSYRSKVMMSVNNGTTTLSYATPELKSLIKTLSIAPASTNPLYNPSIAAVSSLDGQNFTAQLPVPSNTNLGVAYKATDKLLVSAELQYVGWKAYDTLTIRFPSIKSVTPKNFKNTMIYRIGGEYKATEKITARLGFVYDTTPVDLTQYGPESPGSNKISVTAGMTYQPFKAMAVDLGFQYNTGMKTTGLIVQNGVTTFGGDYKTLAFLPSLGLRFNF